MPAAHGPGLASLVQRAVCRESRCRLSNHQTSTQKPAAASAAPERPSAALAELNKSLPALERAPCARGGGRCAQCGDLPGRSRLESSDLSWLTRFAHRRWTGSRVLIHALAKRHAHVSEFHPSPHYKTLERFVR